jgi:hypothetical protein
VPHLPQEEVLVARVGQVLPLSKRGAEVLHALPK